METQDKKYIEGFNSGYFLAAHEPELVAALFDGPQVAESRSQYFMGLVAGKQQHETEVKAWFNRFSQWNPSKSDT